ncbi:Kinesin- protein 6 [Boothiomyces macroporosus]|uniref:Kinesin-like protein n=1 Tax=Boothiomyces macroporosus TaxID=261099 RepID=A0AAD5UGY4_9FUNG|nr:Kinesin- protein 6 [Boothiomyces macroporosus]
MVSSTIQVYGRIRPIKKNAKFKASAGRYWVEQSENMEKVGFHVPKDLQQGLINHQKENYEFQFNKVFDTESGQEEVFDVVAKPIIDSRDAKKLEDLPKVTLMEDENEMIHLRNLSVVPANNEEDALNLLFVGDTNRMIAETPSNPSSSRSHCVFIITLTCRKAGQDVIRRSKLHLVDLAGSERVARTGIDGTLLKEAKHINLSLHYLEQVIIALHESSKGKRTHIPYRNSMMTSVLRDSLGGNCKTTMIATIAVEDMLIEESISTCRFAQRVALIANNATLNEELDPQLTIIRLKAEIARLRAELAIARGETTENNDELPDYEKERFSFTDIRIQTAVEEYLQNTDENAELVFSDYKKIQYAFRLMKTRIINGGGVITCSKSTTLSDNIEFDEQGLTIKQLEQFNKLKQLAAHRDNEINILVGMIAQLKKKLEPSSETGTKSEIVPTMKRTVISTITPEGGDLKKSLPQLSTEKAKAFELFKQSYPSADWIDRQKQVLKAKYTEAKQLGAKAGNLRNEMKIIKEKLADLENTPDLEAQRLKLSNLILEYKSSYQSLKELKAEIEHLQHLLEQARIRMTRDFEAWYVEVYQMDNDTIARYRNNPIVNQDKGDFSDSCAEEIQTTKSMFKSEAWVNPVMDSPTFDSSKDSTPEPKMNYPSATCKMKPDFNLMSANVSSKTLVDEYVDTNALSNYQRIQNSRSSSRLGNYEPARPLSSLSSSTTLDKKYRPPSRLDKLSNDSVHSDIQAFYKARDQLLAKK